MWSCSLLHSSHLTCVSLWLILMMVEIRTGFLSSVDVVKIWKVHEFGTFCSSWLSPHAAVCVVFFSPTRLVSNLFFFLSFAKITQHATFFLFIYNENANNSRTSKRTNPLRSGTTQLSTYTNILFCSETQMSPCYFSLYVEEIMLI